MVWDRLANAAYNYGVMNLTVVNAGAVLPCNMKLEYHERSVQDDVDDPCPIPEGEHWEAFEEVANELWGSQEPFDHLFTTMQNWIRRNAWEDVFTSTEMEPWLECVRKEDEERAKYEQQQKDEEKARRAQRQEAEERVSVRSPDVCVGKSQAIRALDADQVNALLFVQ